MFDEQAVRNFLSTMGDLCKDWSRGDLEARFPRSLWLRGSGGNAKGILDWMIFTLLADKGLGVNELQAKIVAIYKNWASSKNAQGGFETALEEKSMPVTTTMNMVVKLNGWGVVDRSRVMIPTIGPVELSVFRMIESIFNRTDASREAYQCRCGRLFVISKEQITKVPKDENGLPLCNVCAQIEVPEDTFRQDLDKFVAITNALLAFERCSNAEKEQRFKELEKVCKLWIPTSSLERIYIGYFEMLERLEKDSPFQESLLNGLDKRHAQILDDLFDQARLSSSTEFEKLLFSMDFPEIKEIDDTVNSMFFSLARMEKDYFLPKVCNYPIFVSEVSAMDIARMKTRTQLLAYSHLVELGSLYDVLLNLIEIAKGKPFATEPFLTHGKSSEEYDHPLRKIKKIEDEHPKTAKILRSFYDNHIRNAFAHSQYLLIEDGIYLSKYKAKIPARELEDKFKKVDAFWKHLRRKISIEEIGVYRKRVGSK